MYPWHPAAGKLRFFWDWRRWRTWGLQGPVPVLPYDWRLFAGPLCVARVTTNSPTKMTRQRRRALKRAIAKAARRA